MHRFLDGFALEPRVVEDTIEKVRAVAIWNRNTWAKRTVTIVTTNREDAELDAHQLSSLRRRDKDYGVCWIRGLQAHIWLAPERNSEECMDTLIHEVAHAFCGAGTSHDGPWRRLNTIAQVLVRDLNDNEGSILAHAVVEGSTRPREAGWYQAPGPIKDGYYAEEYYPAESHSDWMKRVEKEATRAIAGFQKARSDKVLKDFV